MHIWLETFRCNCTRVQLNNKRGGELHEIKHRGKTEIGKEIIWGQKNNVCVWGYMLKKLG